MPIFDFGINVIDEVKEELEKAREFIKIAIFQIHNDEIFKLLENKIAENVKVEIFTLPYESINENVREKVINRFERIKKKGAIIYKCYWNIGDPERTTTAVNQWFSFHGKFIVTDHSAIALSANFTEDHEIDAMLIYDDKTSIINFCHKFDNLISLFIQNDIKNLVISSGYTEYKQLFETPRTVNNELLKDYWIKDYPTVLCKEPEIIIDGLYLCPFEIKARKYIYRIIDEAESYIYLSTESFTDEEFSTFLVDKKLKNNRIDIKLFTGTKSMDFTDRLNRMLKNMIASGIVINTTSDNIHAKLLLTEKRLLVSSINLNKMNLGFSRNTNLWRGNTETLMLNSNKEIINIAKNKFNTIFGNDSVIKLLEEKQIPLVRKIFSRYNLRVSKEVKNAFARLIYSQELNIIQIRNKLGGITAKIMSDDGRKTVEMSDFTRAYILFLLSERMMGFDEIQKKILKVNSESNTNELLINLETKNLIEKDKDNYKLNIERLF